MGELKFPVPLKDLPPGYDFNPRDIRKVKGVKVLDPGWWKNIKPRNRRGTKPVKT